MEIAPGIHRVDGVRGCNVYLLKDYFWAVSGFNRLRRLATLASPRSSS